jgi:hypothetical protein
MFGSVRLARWDRAALFCERRWPKVIGDLDGEPPPRFDLGSAGDALVTAVRLVVGGDVRRGTEIALSSDSRLHGGEGASHLRRPVTVGVDISRPAVVRPQDIGPLRTTFDSVRSEAVGSDAALMLALRRYSQRPTRIEVEDALLDLMISCEALFLGSRRGGGSDRGELRHRLALNASLGAPIGGARPSAVRRFMRTAYDARSRIVHGDRVNRLRALSGGSCDLRTLTSDLELVVQANLRRAVQLAADGDDFRTWDSDLDLRLDGGHGAGG